ncbi:MAG: helix-turn-helix domain-containing protein [Alistipes sp.]|nr:helix-turn-helix domain-containing protein [Alistipes sp.]MBR4046814.1 helix-turn-helix domain-containing protein [Alistipes sp.]
MRQDGIKRASIDKLKSRFETAYYSEDMVITPLVMFRELDDLTALIQGVSIGVTVSGTAKIKINGKLHELRPNTLFIFNENTVIEQVKASIRSSGYMITYSRQYLNSIHVDTQDLISIYHGFLDEPCVQVDPEEAAYIHDISKLMRSVLCDYAPTSNREKIISSLFAAMFHYVMGILQKHSLPAGNDSVSNRTDELFNKFLDLLREYCSTERSVEFYASKMGITPKYLSLILKKKSGRNASKLIDEAVVYEAKRLLKYSGMSINEIATKLNFASQSFFGKYFKQRVGVSPSRYKIWDGRTEDIIAHEDPFGEAEAL